MRAFLRIFLLAVFAANSPFAALYIVAKDHERAIVHLLCALIAVVVDYGLDLADIKELISRPDRRSGP